MVNYRFVLFYLFTLTVSLPLLLRDGRLHLFRLHLDVCSVVVVLFQKERKKYSIGVAMQTDGSLENSRTGHGRKLERCIRSSKDPKKGIS